MNELALRGGTDVPAAFDQQMQMAKVLSESTLLPAHLRGKPANVLIIIQGARAMGVSAFWALQSMYVVEGKLSMSAELMRALVIRAGHEFKILEHTNKVAKVGIRRQGTDYWFETEFTWADAQAAGLVSKGPWKSYPSSMLLARVTSKACRAYCPDVLFGVVYTPEELNVKVDEDGAPVTNPDGSPVLDGEVIEVDQQMIDRVAELLRVENLDVCANAYLTVYKLDAGNRQPSDGDLNLQGLWLKRLMEATGVATKDDLKLIWRYANGTGVLEPMQPLIDERLDVLDNSPAEPEQSPLVDAARASWDE